MIGKILTKIKKIIIKDSPLLYCPFAIKNQDDIILPTKGKYKKNYPIGAVIHYTAGRSLSDKVDAINVLSHMKQSDYCTFVISANGYIFQNFSLDQWGQHAGLCTYPRLNNMLSSQTVGIEICCAGKVEKIDDKYISWFKEEYHSNDVRIIVTDYYNWKKGYYHKYTFDQERSLIQLLLWLKKNNPDIFSFDNVLGHDEVAPLRKSDPGGSLSMPMPKFRSYITQKYLTEK